MDDVDAVNAQIALLNGRADNVIYGAAAPGAPPVFIDDANLARMWKEPARLYLVVPDESRPRLDSLLDGVHVFAARGGKCVLTNLPK